MPTNRVHQQWSSRTPCASIYPGAPDARQVGARSPGWTTSARARSWSGRGRSRRRPSTSASSRRGPAVLRGLPIARRLTVLVVLGRGSPRRRAAWSRTRRPARSWGSRRRPRSPPPPRRPPTASRSWGARRKSSRAWPSRSTTLSAAGAAAPPAAGRAAQPRAHGAAIADEPVLYDNFAPYAYMDPSGQYGGTAVQSGSGSMITSPPPTSAGAATHNDGDRNHFRFQHARARGGPSPPTRRAAPISPRHLPGARAPARRTARGRPRPPRATSPGPGRGDPWQYIDVGDGGYVGAPDQQERHVHRPAGHQLHHAPVDFQRRRCARRMRPRRVDLPRSRSRPAAPATSCSTAFAPMKAELQPSAPAHRPSARAAGRLGTAGSEQRDQRPTRRPRHDIERAIALVGIAGAARDHQADRPHRSRGPSAASTPWTNVGAGPAGTGAGPSPRPRPGTNIAVLTHLVRWEARLPGGARFTSWPTPRRRRRDV